MGTLLGFFQPGPMELLIIGIVAVLLFGKRLPEVGRSLGKGLVEFKKGLRGIEDEVTSAGSYSTTTSTPAVQSEDQEEATAPKFEPPSSEPQPEEETGV